jgi:hypothetical protein
MERSLWCEAIFFMQAAFVALWVAFLFLGYVVIAIRIIVRNKAARALRLPIESKLLRLPGESLGIKADELLEKMMEKLLHGAAAATILLPMPFLMLTWEPKADGKWLLGSSACLFVAASIYYIRQAVKLGMERANYRLGQAGEREVAAQLHALQAEGYLVFHDVPMERESGMENIDHMAVGPHGLVVIETKARGIPASDKFENDKVSFDGTRLIWPRWPDDQKTVWQVNRCAEWAGRLVREVCGKEVFIQQIIAIPGWEVIPGRSQNPRVLNPGGMKNAFEMMIMDRPVVLKQADIKRLTARLEQLCRNVEW